MRFEFNVFKVKTITDQGIIRAEWSPPSVNNTRLYSGCGNTVKEALHSLVDLLLEEDTLEDILVEEEEIKSGKVLPTNLKVGELFLKKVPIILSSGRVVEGTEPYIYTKDGWERVNFMTDDSIEVSLGYGGNREKLELMEDER